MEEGRVGRVGEGRGVGGGGNDRGGRKNQSGRIHISFLINAVIRDLSGGFCVEVIVVGPWLVCTILSEPSLGPLSGLQSLPDC